MADNAPPSSWRDELVSLVDDPGVHYVAEGFGIGEKKRMDFRSINDGAEHQKVEESLQEQVKGFLHASAEMLHELAVGCKDILQQTLEDNDSFLVRHFGGPCAVVSSKLKFLNDYLPEDKDPVHAWPVVLLVFFLALSVLMTGGEQKLPVSQNNKLPLRIPRSPPNATRIQLPDGRYVAYQEQGVPQDQARYSLITTHSFLSSRLAGLPGISLSLLEEFGVRLVTYDLPGFGESDPHPYRNLNTSAQDLSNIADAVGIKDKFWILGYSGGGIHAWAALRYIPERLAGAALFAPMGNPYEQKMTKEERHKTWDKWTLQRKLLLFLARRLPSLLPYFYQRSFLSGGPIQPAKWLALSLGKKDKSMVEDPAFSEFWSRDVDESTRQGNPAPFVEESVLQVSDWGFSLADLQVQKKGKDKGFFPWIKSMYSTIEREWTGFLGPIHIWQGMDDRVVPPAMNEYARRVVPGATVHRLIGEGHFSYFCFCDECHRNIFSILFGTPQGPLNRTQEEETPQDFPPAEEPLIDTKVEQID
ncbi:hypothetical protein EJ110_NYTH33322 [Nymphaea thermarum]|nr:hypothetical protein EJ110_NYTH33322 [Nymphaea thermarum]